MACPCCDPCGIKCGGAGAPRELAVTITGVTFRNDSIYDADDLPFPIPSTFLVPVVGVECRNWEAFFYPRATACAPCDGTTTFNGLLFTFSESGGSLIVQILIASGSTGAFNACIGPATRFFETKGNLATPPATPICGIPFSSTITASSAICPLQSVSYTVEPA